MVESGQLACSLRDGDIMVTYHEPLNRHTRRMYTKRIAEVWRAPDLQDVQHPIWKCKEFTVELDRRYLTGSITFRNKTTHFYIDLD